MRGCDLKIRDVKVRNMKIRGVNVRNVRVCDVKVKHMKVHDVKACNVRVRNVKTQDGWLCMYLLVLYRGQHRAAPKHTFCFIPEVLSVKWPRSVPSHFSCANFRRNCPGPT